MERAKDMREMCRGDNEKHGCHVSSGGSVATSTIRTHCV